MGIHQQREGDGRHQDLIDDELLPVKHVILLKVHVGENATIVRRTSEIHHGEVAAQTHPTVLVRYEHFILLGRWRARHSEHASRKYGRCLPVQVQTSRCSMSALVVETSK